MITAQMARNKALNAIPEVEERIKNILSKQESDLEALIDSAVSQGENSICKTFIMGSFSCQDLYAGHLKMFGRIAKEYFEDLGYDVDLYYNWLSDSVTVTLSWMKED